MERVGKQCPKAILGKSRAFKCGSKKKKKKKNPLGGLDKG